MNFKTKYNSPEKYISTHKSTKNNDKSHSSSFETDFLSTNVKKTVFKLVNRDLFDQNMDQINIKDKKFQVGKFL